MQFEDKIIKEEFLSGVQKFAKISRVTTVPNSCFFNQMHKLEKLNLKDQTTIMVGFTLMKMKL